MKKLVYLFVLSIVLFTSCSGGAEQSETTSCVPAEFSFSKDVLPVFESNCFSCHNKENYASKADGNLMEGYDDIKKLLDEGLIVGNIEHAPGFLKMPYRKKQITECEIELVKAWVDAGAKND